VKARRESACFVGAPETREAESEKRRNAESKVDNRLGNILEKMGCHSSTSGIYYIKREMRWLNFKERDCAAVKTDGNSSPYEMDRGT
jgi:hypothetical protein